MACPAHSQSSTGTAQMLSQSQQLLLVVALCVSVIRADVDCSKMPKFMDPRSCCPLPEFTTPEVKEKCMEHNLSQAMPTETSGEGRRRRHHPHMLSPCFFVCVFNETGVYKDNELDMAAFKEYLLETYNESPELQSLASEAYTQCAEKMEEYKDRMPSNRPPLEEMSGKHKCPHKPLFLMGCIFRKMLHNCPASIWNDSEECNERREFFQNCHRPRFGKERADGKN